MKSLTYLKHRLLLCKASSVVLVSLPHCLLEPNDLELIF
jgi:hypothetical protein